MTYVKNGLQFLMFKILIYHEEWRCGDGCCSSFEVRATLYDENGGEFDASLCSYYVDDDEAEQLALERWELSRDQVKFI